MSYTQHVMTLADARRAGIAVSEERPDADIAIICERDADSAVMWVSYAPPDQPAAERLNPTIPAIDWRAP